MEIGAEGQSEAKTGLPARGRLTGCPIPYRIVTRPRAGLFTPFWPVPGRTPSVPNRVFDMALGVPANVLGLMVSGDIGGFTLYTDRYGRKVIFEKAPPTKPASVLQALQRGRFRSAMINWKAETQAVRDDWENVSLKAALCMTGLNMWLHFSLKGTAAGLATFSRQTGITLTMPPTV